MSDNPQNPGTVPGADAQNQGTQGQGQNPTPPKTFTQAELDAIIEDRLQRERKKYGDYDTLRERAAKLQTIEDAQKSEQQKLQEQLAALQKQTELATGQRRDALVRSAIVAAAAKAGVADPVDAYSLLDKSKIEIKDDDTVNGVAEAIAALIEAKPYLLKTTPTTGRQTTTPANPSGTANQSSVDWYKKQRGRGSGGFGRGGVIEPGE